MVLTRGQGWQSLPGREEHKACDLLPGLTYPGPKGRAGEAEACGFEP